MRTDSIRLVNGEILFKRHTSVGPRHDPYSRDIVERWNGKDTVWRLVSCGLAGEWLETAAGEKIEFPEVMFVAKEERAKLRDQWEQKVQQVTGQSSRFWLDKVWEMRDRARWRRMTPEQRYEYEMCMEADAALLSYAE